MTMMRGNYADLVRRVVRQFRSEPTPSVPKDKRRLVAAVEEALRARARRRARVRSVVRSFVGATVGVAALLALVVGGGALWRRAGESHAERTGAPAARALMVLGSGDDARGDVISGDSRHLQLQRGMALEAGVRVVASPLGELRFGTAQGTLLALEPRGDLTVTEAGSTQRFALRSGAVRARVARLSAGERFLIETADAEIEVHGTAFRVAVVAADPTCGEGTTTRVSVSEGVVSVRAGGRQARIYPNGAWPEGCATAPSAAPATAHAVAPPPIVAANVERSTHGARVPLERPAPSVPGVQPRPASPVTPASDLVSQNDLFSAAVEAKKDGRLSEAARLFGKLAAEHPRSPLLESATVQRMKLLAAIDPEAAARAAADYLARFPSGFARPDAEKLVARSAP
jgi:FecR protein